MADSPSVSADCGTDPETFRRLLSGVTQLGLDIIYRAYRLNRIESSQAGGTMQHFMSMANAYERAARAVRHARILQAHAEGRAVLRRRLDPEDDILDRPAGAAIAAMCRDLGLAMAALPQRWRPQTPADLLALCERAAGTVSTAGLSLHQQRALLRSLPADAPKH